MYKGVATDFKVGGGVQGMASGSEPEIFLSVPPIRGVQNSTRAINLGVHATA